MGATVRAECGDCGTVEVPIGTARVVFTAQSGGPSSSIEFRCPRCRRQHVEQIGDRAVRLLTEAGITVVAAPPPARQVAPAGDDTRSGDRTR